MNPYQLTNFGARLARSGILSHGLPLFIVFFSISTRDAQAQSNQVFYNVTDNSGWSAGFSQVTSATETYTYDAANDRVTVTVVFDRSDFIPLPPLLAMAMDYQFPVTLDTSVFDTGQKTRFGPVRGCKNTNRYSYSVTGLSKYVLDRPVLGASGPAADLQQKLDAAIDQVLSAGHLAPWYLQRKLGGSAGDVYWEHPGDTLYLLSEMAPLLSSARVQQLKTYLENERASYPPESTWTMDYLTGTRRDYQPPPDQFINNAGWGMELNLAWYALGPVGFPTVPKIQALYGLARAAEITGELPAMDKCNAIVNAGLQHADWATLYWQRGHSPHFNAVQGVNEMFAGFIGYVRLARQASDPGAEALGWGMLAKMAILRFAMGKYTQYESSIGILPLGATLSSNPSTDPAWWAKKHAANWSTDLLSFNWTKPIDNVRQVTTLDDFSIDTWEWGGTGADSGGTRSQTGQKSDALYSNFIIPVSDLPWFIDMKQSNNYRPDHAPYLLPFADIVPELGRFLGDYLKPEGQAFINRVQENQPGWHIAYADSVLMGETDFTFPADSHGLFMAEAWVLKDPADDLRKRIDVSWLKMGDYFYMHKLAETIKSYRGVTWQSANASGTAPGAPKGFRKR